jgi:amino acid transporter
MAAKDGIMPTFLNRENAQKVPSVSLWMTNIADFIIKGYTWLLEKSAIGK